jgi:hypothetical protein
MFEKSGWNYEGFISFGIMTPKTESVVAELI